MRILLVEDDPTIVAPLAKGLAREGHEVRCVGSGAEALADLDTDLVLLDLGLPDLDGVEVCRRIRADHAVPIIVVTARGDEFDRVMGLEMGADDYLVKPFGFRELTARIRAVTRRAGLAGQDIESSEIVRVGELEVDRRSRRVRLGARAIELTPKEYALLSMLAEDPGAVCTRGDILDRVWDPHWYGPTKTLDVHLATLRRKLGDPTLIETVRGVGFRLRVPEAPPGRPPTTEPTPSTGPS